LNSAEIIILFVFLSLLASFTVRASLELHRRCLKSVSQAAVSFFDETPIGRILARFSNDIVAIDNDLIRLLFVSLSAGAAIISTLIGMAIGAPWMLLISVPLAVVFYRLYSIFQRTAIQMTRFESTIRAPIHSHFSESVAGVSTIRAYQLSKQFEHKNTTNLRVAQSVTFSCRFCNQYASTSSSPYI